MSKFQADVQTAFIFIAGDILFPLPKHGADRKQLGT